MTISAVQGGKSSTPVSRMPRSAKRERRIFSLYLTGAVLWAVFSLSLAVWWIIFGSHQIEALSALEGAELIAKKQRMLLWEGVTLFLLLLGGSVALGYFIVQERRQRQAIRRFLATFTHELKTPLASLRLQAETLREEVTDERASRLIERLVADTSRLTLQLENSLQLAETLGERAGSRSLMTEEIVLSELLSSVSDSWPMVALDLRADAQVSADRRALLSITQNIIQNSVTHGMANKLTISPREAKPGMVAIQFHDNGSGFSGDRSRIGELFQRLSPRSGSGIGLYLARRLAKQMDGDLIIEAPAQGFSVTIQIPGAVLDDE